MTKKMIHKTFSQDLELAVLENYFDKNFLAANYLSAYEARFAVLVYTVNSKSLV